jgi:hypothetical protein
MQHPQQRDLAPEQERPERQRAPPDAERHPDPDLAPLRLDAPADEIERRERCPPSSRAAKISIIC